jgi:bacteriorhodopsin
MAAPWLELGEDVSEGMTYYVNTLVEAALALANSPQALELVRRIEQRPLTRALKELDEDCGGLWLPACISALCPVASGPLMLAGVATPLKITYGLCAGMSLYGIHKFYTAKAGLSPQSQSLFNRAIGVMLMSGIVHVAVASGGLPILAQHVGLPAAVIEKIVYPEVLLYSIGNLITYPFILINMGYVAGATSNQMVPCIALNAVGNFFMVYSCMALPWGHAFISSGVSAIFFFGSTLSMSGLVEGASQLSYANRNRIEHSIDATMFFWTLAPLIQAFAIFNLVGPEQHRVAFALLDLPCKLGVLHILVRSRPAIEAAAHHFEEPP